MKKTKNKRKLLLGILIIFTLLTCLSNVSAEDASDLSIQDSSIDAGLTTQDVSIDDVESVDDDTCLKQDSTNASLEEDYSSDNVKGSSSNGLQSSKLGKDIYLYGGSFQDIQDAIDSANAGGTIYLNGYAYNGEGVIYLNKPINIIGANKADQYAILNGMKKTHMFFISFARDVNLSNIVFTNGYHTCADPNHFYPGDGGGAINAEGSPNLKITNCVFIKNHNSDRGGAIYITDMMKNVTNALIENCTFVENSVTVGWMVLVALFISLINKLGLETALLYQIPLKMEVLSILFSLLQYLTLPL